MNLSTADLTITELNELPEFQAYEYIEVVVQSDDRKRGFIMVEGKELAISLSCRLGDRIRIPKLQRMLLGPGGPKEVIFWPDMMGNLWQPAYREDADGETILGKRRWL